MKLLLRFLLALIVAGMLMAPILMENEDVSGKYASTTKQRY